MIKATGEIDGRETFVMGLSDENIRRLQEGSPIHFDGRPYGLETDVLIMAGKDEGELARMLGVSDWRDDRVVVEEGAP